MNPADPDTEQQILEAAHAVFLRRGTAGARMQEIADEAGLNKALLHYYFRGKEQLAEAVFQRAARQLLPPVLGALMSDAPIEEKVQRVVAIELEVLAANPFLPGYILSELSHQPERAAQLLATMSGMTVDGLGQRLVTTLDRQIDEQVRSGSMRPIAPAEFVVNLLALCIFPFAAQPMLRAVLGWDQSGFDAFIEERKRTLAEFFLRGLRP